MIIANEEYPKFEAIWISLPTYESRRARLEEELLTYKHSFLIQLELYLWAHLKFGDIKDKTTAKAIYSILLQILGEESVIDDGYMVKAE